MLRVLANTAVINTVSLLNCCRHFYEKNYFLRLYFFRHIFTQSSL